MGHKDSVFVFGLARSTSESDVAALFGKYDVRRVTILRDRKTGSSRGFAFVKLRSADDARRAIVELQGAELHDRILSFEPVGKPAGGPRKAKRLFCRGLPFEMCRVALRELFARFGQVQEARIILDANNKSRGFGFVAMTEDAAADAALAELDGATVGGRVINVALARERYEG